MYYVIHYVIENYATQFLITVMMNTAPLSF